MRGRLINPVMAKVERLHTVSTAADPDGAGELTSGYDSVFREPRRLPSTGTVATKYYPAVLIPCQFEPEDMFEKLGQTAGGNDPDSLVRVVFHFADLEELNLVDVATGDALLRLNDRLIAIHRFSDQTLMQRAGLEEGLYCTEARPVSFGLAGGERNLLICSYAARDDSFKG